MVKLNTQFRLIGLVETWTSCKKSFNVFGVTFGMWRYIEDREDALKFS